MAPIDYSKWDNIDTDSEPETASPQPPAPKAAAPKAALPSAPVTPHASVLTSPPTQGDASGHIRAVIVRCEAEKHASPPWSSTTIPSDHAVFSNAVPPIPGLIGVPLVVHCVGTRSANRADLDNSIAMYLNIDAKSGFAPPPW
ncbi:hypothetical protein G7Z17_g1376 [Cylindrodendrum hubeiense]|uniref:Uncharacterized protein n=1 Tax=Cylindrodendrum hubeiense TaxID=595255 RepID=A0A9P5HIK1_9HYPO|nr:hypothetical protein G7Z17_g1376 [Cylindrodendrum hubeiense]